MLVGILWGMALPAVAQGVNQSLDKDPLAPHISTAHRRFLSKVVRRTVRDVAAGRAMYTPGYVPEALGRLEAEVVVRLRYRGFLLAAGVGGPAPVAVATRDAALTAFKQVVDQRLHDISRVDELLAEIEVVGEAVPFAVEADWTRPGALDAYIESGIHGMVIVGPKGSRRFLPTEAHTSGTRLPQALTRLAMDTHGASSDLPKATLLRFRTTHWYQSPHSEPVVSLSRGLSLVPDDAVNPETLDDVIGKIAEYMAYRQLATGLFTYQYEPALDRYSAEDNILHQAGAVAAMSLHARWSGKSASLGAANAGIRHHLQGLTDIPDVSDAAFIATPDGHNKLGVTAMMAMSLARHPDADRFDDVRRKLVNGMLWLQRPSGMFITAFPPAERISEQDHYPGEALLALAMEYDVRPTARVLDASSLAMDFYRGLFRERMNPALVPWQTQAFALLARHSKRRATIDYVFEMTDALAARRLDESNCAWPELYGGIAAYRPGRADVTTATFLEGFADALTLARQVGDKTRIARYEALVRGAARFVMQLQVRPEEAYFIRSPRDAVGGIRRTPTLNLLRINHCQHALVALIKTRDVLFPDRD